MYMRKIREQVYECNRIQNNRLHAVSRTKQDRKRESSVKTLLLKKKTQNNNFFCLFNSFNLRILKEFGLENK